MTSYNKIMEAFDTALNNTPSEKAQDMFVTEAFNMIREEEPRMTW